MTINNNNKMKVEDRDITLVKKCIEEELNRYEPKELNGILWGKGLKGSMGPLSTDYLVDEEYFSKESVDFVEKHDLIDYFQDYYFDWHTHTSNEIGTTDEDYLKIEDEEERSRSANEDTDDDGMVWYGFKNYIYELADESLIEVIEIKLDEYSQVLNKEGFDTYYDNSWDIPVLMIDFDDNENDKLYFNVLIEISLGKNGVLFNEYITFEKENFEEEGQDEDFTYKSFDDLLSKLKEEKNLMNNNNILAVA